MFDTALISSFYRSLPYWALFALAGVLGVAWLAVRHALLARRFRRTNEAGVQMFRSYSHMYITRMIEQLATLFGQLLLFAAAICTLAAVLKGMAP